MSRREEVDPYEAAVTRLVELYRAGAELAECAGDAERIFEEARALGSRVRRRTRRGEARGADSADLEAVERLTDRLAALVAAAQARPEMSELRTALAEEAHQKSAALAVRLYVGLAREAPPEHLFWRLAVRRRRRDLGESLPAPAAFAREVGEIVACGLLAEGDASAAPEPIVLAPSWEACGAEAALRLPAATLGDTALHHLASGDWWCFRRRIDGPFSVCLARTADDEWWTASPLPYDRYAAEVEEALARAGIVCERMP